MQWRLSLSNDILVVWAQDHAIPLKSTHEVEYTTHLPIHSQHRAHVCMFVVEQNVHPLLDPAELTIFYIKQQHVMKPSLTTRLTKVFGN